MADNYSYFPIFIEENEYCQTRDEVYFVLQKENIFGRRYFYPLMSHFHPDNSFVSSASSNLAFAETMTKEVICSPIYPNLDLLQIYQS